MNAVRRSLNACFVRMFCSAVRWTLFGVQWTAFGVRRCCCLRFVRRSIERRWMFGLVLVVLFGLAVVVFVVGVRWTVADSGWTFCFVQGVVRLERTFVFAERCSLPVLFIWVHVLYIVVSNVSNSKLVPVVTEFCERVFLLEFILYSILDTEIEPMKLLLIWVGLVSCVKVK